MFDPDVLMGMGIIMLMAMAIHTICVHIIGGKPRLFVVAFCFFIVIACCFLLFAGDSIEAQTEQSIRNIAAILAVK